MTQREAFEAQIETFLADFDEDEQERVLRYALDHIVPRLKKQAAQAQAAAPEPLIPFKHGCKWCGKAKCAVGCPGAQSAAPSQYGSPELQDLILENLKEKAAVEPVAWAMQRPDGLVLDVICPDEHESHEGKYTVPLYTSPPDDTKAMRLALEALHLSRYDVESCIAENLQFAGYERYDRRIAFHKEQLVKHDAAIAALEGSLK